MPVWISIILIIIAIIVVIFILLKKFPALAILDVEQIPGEKEAKFKERIIKQRLERDLSIFSKFISKIWTLFNNFLTNNYQRLKNIKKLSVDKNKINLAKRREKIDKLYIEVKEDLKKEEYDLAEEKLIEIISLDDKELFAFLELGNLYYEIKKYSEALASWQHLLKLSLINNKNKVETEEPISLQEIRYLLADVSSQLNDVDGAIDYILQALDSDSNNPRYLDLIFHLSIMKNDKKMAEEYFEKLVLVNPENRKLAELKEKIKSIKEEN